MISGYPLGQPLFFFYLFFVGVVDTLSLIYVVLSNLTNYDFAILLYEHTLVCRFGGELPAAKVEP